MGSQLTNVTMVSGDDAAGEDAVLAGLRRGLGRDGISIPAYQTLGVDVREATAGSAVVRLPRVTAPGGAGRRPAARCLRHTGRRVLRLRRRRRPARWGRRADGPATRRVDPSAPRSAIPGSRAEPRPPRSKRTGSGLARREIIDEADQLLGVASLRVIKASHQGFRQATPAASAPAPPQPRLPRAGTGRRPGPDPGQ